MIKKIYLDHSATTPVRQAVVNEMLPYFIEVFGNPSSIHAFGRDARNQINRSREIVADFIGAKADEVYFTAGGSESDNWALKGVAESYRQKGNHIITTKIEHHAILHTCEALEKNGFEVTYLEVDGDGLITVEALEAAMKDTTILVSVMAINNEIGTILPIKEIGALCKSKGILFHTDAVQALGNIPLNVDEQNIDLLSMSSHKIYGPKGVGALYIRKGVRIKNLIEGGAQERKRRAGTENVPGIVGFGKAVEIAKEQFDSHVLHLTTLRDRLMTGILETIPYVKLNGHKTLRHPGNVNVCFEFIEGESLLLSLDLVGIAGSSGSACTSGSLDPSHVLMAIGLPHEIAHGSLRLTVGDSTTVEDIDYTIEQLKIIVERLRSYSPLYDQAKGGK